MTQEENKQLEDWEMEWFDQDDSEDKLIVETISLINITNMSRLLLF